MPPAGPPPPRPSGQRLGRRGATRPAASPRGTADGTPAEVLLGTLDGLRCLPSPPRGEGLSVSLLRNRAIGEHAFCQPKHSQRQPQPGPQFPVPQIAVV